MVITRRIAIAIGVCVIVAGCAAMRAEEAQSTEQLLAASGFEVKLADTPEKQAQLAGMPQDTLVTHDVGGSARYTYADATGCKCIYAGGQGAYDSFQRLKQERQIAEMNQAAAMMNDDAAMNWGMWGPWRGYPDW